MRPEDVLLQLLGEEGGVAVALALAGDRVLGPSVAADLVLLGTIEEVAEEGGGGPVVAVVLRDETQGAMQRINGTALASLLVWATWRYSS